MPMITNDRVSCCLVARNDIALHHMIDTPKRRFWQIHLSTAVVLLIVASVMLWFLLDVIRFERWTVPDADTSDWQRTLTINRHNVIIACLFWIPCMMTILLIIVHQMESIIRRREARKP
jgi:hypothetical protein